MDPRRWRAQLLNHRNAQRDIRILAVVGAMMRPSLPDVTGLPEVNFPHSRSLGQVTSQRGNEIDSSDGSARA